MDTISGRLSVHCGQALSPFCPLKLLLLFLVFDPAPMLWTMIYEVGACIPPLCLKYAVITVANALLATGWLLVVCLRLIAFPAAVHLIWQSVLSVVGELIPKVSQMPPTLPRLPSSPPHELSPLPPTRRVSGGRVQARVSTEISSPPPRRTASDHNVSHRVQFTLANNNNGTLSSMPSTARTEEGSAVSPEIPSAPEAEVSERAVIREMSPPALEQREFGDAAARGRKLSFLRKHLSTSRSLRPLSSHRVSSPDELPTSRGASPARSDHSASGKSNKTLLLFRVTDRYFALVKSCLKKSQSQDSVVKAVPRTDPYQAPYFFPSPLSPDAAGYTSRVRAERVLSSEAHPRTMSPETYELEASTSVASDPQVASSSKLPSTPSKKSRPTRSWHISFRSEETERQASWNSEVATLSSGPQTPSDSSDHPPSPELKLRKPLGRRCVFKFSSRNTVSYGRSRRSNGRTLSALTPLESISGAEDMQILSLSALPGAKLMARKTWHLPFRHRRVDSQDSISSQPLSDHAVDELPRPRARPVMQKTV